MEKARQPSLHPLQNARAFDRPKQSKPIFARCKFSSSVVGRDDYYDDDDDDDDDNGPYNNRTSGGIYSPRTPLLRSLHSNTLAKIISVNCGMTKKWTRNPIRIIVANNGLYMRS